MPGDAFIGGTYLAGERGNAPLTSSVTYPGVVVPAIPPRPPQVNLLTSAIRPDLTSDPANPVYQLGAEQLAMLRGSTLGSL